VQFPEEGKGIKPTFQLMDSQETFAFFIGKKARAGMDNKESRLFKEARRQN
jgi:hypothetical protein